MKRDMHRTKATSGLKPWLLTLSLCGAWACEGEPPPAQQAPDSITAGAELPPIAGVMSQGGTEAPPQAGAPPEPIAPFMPGGRVWSRLTSVQYAHSVEDALFIDLDTLGLALEPDTNPYLFNSIGAASATVSALGVEQYVEAAHELATHYLERRQLIELELNCVPTELRDGCADQWLRSLGLRLYRRPLEGDEIERWLALGEQVQGGGSDWATGAEAIVAGMLQSPWALYRLEEGEPHPERPELSRYTSLELASRLSFVLLNSPPDTQLITLALEGALTEDEVLEAEVERLLAHPRAREAVMDFFLQFLDVPRLRRVSRDPARYPGFTPSLLGAMEMEVRLLVDDLIYRRDADIRLLLSEPRAFVNSTLAEHYGLPLEGRAPVVFEPVELDPNGPRVGFLGLGAFLTMNAHPTDTSPTLRGKYIRERLLCQKVPPPPDNVDLNIEGEQGEARTLRERLEQHREDPACVGCHSFIDPPGFLFEHFDSVGRYRQEVEGALIDASGDLDGVPMEDSGALGRYLAQEPRVTQCMTKQLYRYALGRLEIPSEESELERLHERWSQEGYRFKALLKLLVMSEGFRSFDPEAQAATPEGAE